MSTPEREELRAFRQHVYTLFGCRRDALFELVDAGLTAPAIETPAPLGGAPPPFCSSDAGAVSVQVGLALADDRVCLRVRLRGGRCFSADPRSDAPAPRGAAAPAGGEVRLQRPRHLARAERPVVD